MNYSTQTFHINAHSTRFNLYNCVNNQCAWPVFHIIQWSSLYFVGECSEFIDHIFFFSLKLLHRFKNPLVPPLVHFLLREYMPTIVNCLLIVLNGMEEPLSARIHISLRNKTSYAPQKKKNSVIYLLLLLQPNLLFLAKKTQP